MNFEQADALNEVIRAVGVRHRALSIAALAPFGIHPGHKLVLFELDTAGPRTQAQLAAATEERFSDGSGSGSLMPAAQRASGAWPVSEWGIRW